jgi:hypothetical protein
LSPEAYLGPVVAGWFGSIVCLSADDRAKVAGDDTKAGTPTPPGAVLFSPPGDPSPELLPEAGTPTPPGAVLFSPPGDPQLRVGPAE